MATPLEPKLPSVARSAIVRTLGFLALWVVLIGPGLLDLSVGVVAAAVAAWSSLRLTPPGPRRLRWGAVLAAVPYFVWKSLLAGVDVARRALAWRVRVKPGFITYPVALERGTPRTFFAMFTSLMPGTLPCADAPDGGLVYHCLDVDLHVAGELARDKAVVAATMTEPGNA